MFTGIIECMGQILNITEQDSTRIYTIKSNISHLLKIDQSVAHNGICLTVIACTHDTHTVCAVQETLRTTTMRNWKIGDLVNLERCMQINARLDGHIVQGHVDTTSQCLDIQVIQNNWTYTFSLPATYEHLIVNKGSICINGTSLTCFDVNDTSFKVAIIPYTYEHTTIQFLKKNDYVNLEFDILGKYVQRNLALFNGK